MLAVLAASGAALAQGQPSMLRIGTGGQSGTYFPIGSLIARVVSDVPAGPDCDQPRCGVRGLVAVAQTSNGSVANVTALQGGEVEMALVQADIADWAFRSGEIFAGRPPQDRLRFAAHLYFEAMHVVVRRQAGVAKVGDLRGRAVALDEPGSGTLVHVRNLLAAHGLTEASVRGVYTKPDLALPRMTEGRLDAFFIVAGWPAKAVSDAIAGGTASLLPIEREQAASLTQRNPFLTYSSIPANAYPEQPAIPTLMVGAQLLVRADLSDDTVFAVLDALWSSRGQGILRAGHPRAADIRFEQALSGRSIPLHDGAQRFYRARGLQPG